MDVNRPEAVNRQWRRHLFAMVFSVKPPNICLHFGEAIRECCRAAAIGIDPVRTAPKTGARRYGETWGIRGERTWDALLRKDSGELHPCFTPRIVAFG